MKFIHTYFLTRSLKLRASLIHMEIKRIEKELMLGSLVIYLELVDKVGVNAIIMIITERTFQIWVKEIQDFQAIKAKDARIGCWPVGCSHQITVTVLVLFHHRGRVRTKLEIESLSYFDAQEEPSSMVSHAPISMEAASLTSLAAR